MISLLYSHFVVSALTARPRQSYTTLPGFRLYIKMSSRIKLLSESLINQIAAGEVIERPASVVKELLENSLDAGSRRVAVEVEQGGRRLIRVSDNGCGMSRDDALLCLERHATSKILSSEDLFAIGTLGFRGEALPSIAAVSRLTLTTRERSAGSGTRISAEGGTVKQVIETGAAPGTTIEIRNLFYNLPARRKFLKTMETELGHLSEAVARMALGRPEVHFSLTHNQKTLIDAPAGKDLPARIGQTLGPRITRQLIAVEQNLPELFGESGLKLCGHISEPSLTRSSTRFIYTFVNGRFVRDRLINHAVFEAYRTLVPKGRYPIVVLQLEIPPEEVDVNVHPAKFEVRFHKQGLIHDAVRQTLSEAIESQGRKGVYLPWPEKPSEQQNVPQTPDHAAAVQQALDRYQNKQDLTEPSGPSHPQTSAESTMPAPIPPARPDQRNYFSSLSVIGQLHEMYLLLESEDDLVIIDQHAAHERVVFEKLSADYHTRQVISQALLFPETLELRPVEARALETFLPELQRLGFEIEPFSGNTFAIKAVPAILGNETDVERLILDLVDELVKVEKSQRIEERLDEVFALLSCHSVVRGRRRLGKDEIKTLLQAMDRARHPGQCPHGRDTVVRLSLSSLGKMFGR